MKRKIFSFSLMASIGLLAFGTATLSGCADNSSFVAASVRLSKNNLTLAVGDAYQIKASVSKGYGSDVRWFTSNDSVIRVNGGYIFAVGEGVATVTASIGGGYADCVIIVSGEGQSQNGNSLSINPTSKTINLNATFTINYSAKAEDQSKVTVEFSSSDRTVATVTNAGLVTGVGVGTTQISVIASNGLSKTCTVTVKESGGASGTDRDIAVDTNLNYSGEMNIGSPLLQREFMMSLLSDFNQLTGSSIKFTVTTFEEDNGTAGFGDATSMPAVFPYASDQTLTLFQFNALASIARTDSNWIREQMGDDAYTAAKLQSVVGYPFSSDNGVVMFYNSSVVSESDIDTVDKLFAKAEELGYEVNFQLGNGFYAAGTLMTYAGGKSLYNLTPTVTSYNVSSNFNSDAGIQGAKLARRISNEDTLRKASSAPVGDVLATIIDCSKVQDFKKALGNNYAVAPLPYVDEAKTVRLGSFLGYKFYGINNTLSADDKGIAGNVAKFLCSEYAQAKRYDRYNVRPTLSSLSDYAQGEAHVRALTIQQADKSTIPLTAISSELWSASETAIGSIKTLTETSSDSEYRTILDTLDKACQPNK